MNNSIDKDINNFHKGFITTTQGKHEDPTYLGFRLIFNFDPTHRDFPTGMTLDPLFASPDSDLESAQRYLRANGYKARALMLEEFKNNLEYINSQTPWYWQTLDGLADVWKIETQGENFNPFRGKDKVLTLTCNESIDLRITALADLYRKATFDPQTMRSLVPQNLRYFTLTVQLAEMRTFHRLKKTASEVPINTVLNNQNANLAQIGTDYKDRFEIINDLLSILEFQFSMCEFDFSESFPLEEPVNNGPEMAMAKQKIKIKVKRIKEHHSYKLLDLILGEGPIENQFKPTSGNLSGANISTQGQEFLNRIPDVDSAFNRRNPSQIARIVGGYASDIRNQLENIGANLISRNVNKLNEAITSRLLGNVYGDLRNQSLETIINSFGKRGEDGESLGNIFSLRDLQENPLPKTLGSAFEGLTDGLTKLGGVVKQSELGDVYPGVPGVDQLKGPVKKIGNIYNGGGGEGPSTGGGNNNSGK